MGGPSGQKNKAHKAGRRAGPSARERARQGKEVGVAPRANPRSSGHDGKLQRHLAAKQQRETKRQELLERKRRAAAPVVVAVLPLSEEVDVARFWHGLRTACERGGTDSGGAAADGDMEMDLLMSAGPLVPATVHVASRPRVRLTLLPPPTARNDPLAMADLGRCAEVLLLLLPGGEPAAAAAAGGGGVDAAGQAALAVLRAMGMPPVVCCVVGAGGAASASMKERSAARKRAEKALAAHFAGEHRLLHADTATDLAAVARHLAEHPPAAPPLWRQQRPGVMVERTEYELGPAESSVAATAGPGPSSAAAAAAAAAAGGGGGTLVVYGYVRGAGLSANQLVTVPGAGDFRIQSIHAPLDPNAVRPGGRLAVAGGGAKEQDEGAKSMEAETLTEGGMEAEAAGGGAAAGGGMGLGLGPVAARPDPEQADQLVRENVPEPGADEQTWPTEEEMAAATAPRTRRRKVPEGTSEYQAAWILDGEDYGDDDEEEDDDDDLDELDDPYGMDADGGAAVRKSSGRGRAGGGGGGMHIDEDEEAPELEPIDDDDDAGTDAGDAAMVEEDEEGGGGGYAAALEAARQAREARRGGSSAAAAEASHLDFPDEVDVPLDTAARVRFQKYRGLKSLRTSPWDPKESLPAEYGRVFAFENFKRAHKRAREAAQRATADLDPCSVAPGTYVAICIADVPAAAAARVTAHVAAAAAGTAVPVTVFGLMQHEAKLSVVNFALRKATGYSAPIANKEELLFVTGLRSFTARPVLSSDDPGADKHRTEKFLHTGQHVVASVYAPIMYPPLPVLAFKLPAQIQIQGGPGVAAVAQLAAVGSLRSCDPDRINLKRIILTGVPVRVHRRRATVRFMFHNPDDVRWFKPVELFTKYGRRGRITEPLGTHGTMKCLFDSPLQQRDTVCMALYKRAFPVWPKDMTFAER